MQDLSGEDFFNGIYFSQGKVAEMIPEIKNSLKAEDLVESARELSELKKIQSDIIQQIKLDNPSFFTNFKIGIQSGNHIKIESTLKGASKVLFNALMKVVGIEKNEGEKYVKSAMKGIDFSELKNGKPDREKLKEKVKFMALEKMNTDASGAKVGAGTCVALALAVAVAIAAVAVLVWVVAAFDFWPSTDSIDNSQLKKEQMINSIATNLALAE